MVFVVEGMALPSKPASSTPKWILEVGRLLQIPGCALDSTPKRAPGLTAGQFSTCDDRSSGSGANSKDWISQQLLETAVSPNPPHTECLQRSVQTFICRVSHRNLSGGSPPNRLIIVKQSSHPQPRDCRMTYMQRAPYW